MDVLRQWAEQSTAQIFHSPDQLSKSTEWHHYLSRVYGQATLVKFPIDMRQFTFFYISALRPRDQRLLCARPVLNQLFPFTHPEDAAARYWERDRLSLRRVPGLNEPCLNPPCSDLELPEEINCRRKYDVYTMCDGYCLNTTLANTAWIYPWNRTIDWKKKMAPIHPGPLLDGIAGSKTLTIDDRNGLMAGVPPHNKVEVYHCRDPIGMKGPFKMHRAIGSGIYYDVGKTHILHEQHGEFRFGELKQSAPGVRWHELDGYHRMFNILGRWREAGFDSIQFPNHWEDGIHKFEIWDLRAMEWDKTLRCTHLMITRIRVHHHAEYIASSRPAQVG